MTDAETIKRLVSAGDVEMLRRLESRAVLRRFALPVAALIVALIALAA